MTRVSLYHKSRNDADEEVIFFPSLAFHCKSLEQGFSIKTPFKSPLGFVSKTNGTFISTIAPF